MSAAREEQRARLCQLQEEARGRAQSEDWRGRWWAGVEMEERRTIAVLAGIDDDEATVKRPWGALSQSNRIAISDTARQWSRLLGPMKYA